MADHTGMDPDHAKGAFVTCLCGDCMEKRLADDRNTFYTPHEVADAWTAGWRAGYAKGRNHAVAAPGDAGVRSDPAG